MLNLFNREVADIQSFLLGMDMVYVGGGSTANLLAVWRLHGVDEALREAWWAGVVLAGLSAGAAPQLPGDGCGRASSRRLCLRGRHRRAFCRNRLPRCGVS